MSSTPRALVQGLLCTVALTTIVAGILPSQRGVRRIASNGASEPKLSANGAWVAYKTTSSGVPALAIISVIPSAKPLILVADKSFTQFLWAGNTGLYYQVADSIFYVRSVGGTPKLVSKVAGANPRLYDVDGSDKILVGTRQDSSGGSAIFTVPTDGSTKAVDIKTGANDFFRDLDLDPSGKKITYTSQTARVPHAPIDIRRIDIDGKNDVSISGGGLPRTGVDVGFPRSLTWADSGSTVLFSASKQGTWGLWRVASTATTPVALTAPPQHFQRSGISGDLKTAVFLGTTKAGHAVPMIMPATGGARIPLEPELNWIVAGKPSIDAGGTVVAFAGYPQGSTSTRPELRLIDLDREISVSPRPALSAKLTFQLPLLFGERGTLFLSTGLLPPDPKVQPKIPGLRYAVAVDPKILIPLAAGTGSGQPLSFSATVPNDTALIGFTVYLQGLRVRTSTPLNGDFTRYAELQFLK